MKNMNGILTEISFIDSIPDAQIYDIESMEKSVDGLVLKCGQEDPQIKLSLLEQLGKPQGVAFFEITYTNTAAGYVQIYWDFGKGISEENSNSIYIAKSYKFVSEIIAIENWLNDEKLTTFRIDPPNGTEFTVKSIRIINNKLGKIAKKKIEKEKKVLSKYSVNKILEEMSFIDSIPNATTYDIESVKKSVDGIVLKCGQEDPQIYLQLPRELEKPQGAVLCEIKYSNLVPGNLQVFYDYGEGLSEKNSSRYYIGIRENAILNCLISNWYKDKNLNAIRIDPPNTTEFILNSISIITVNGIRRKKIGRVNKVIKLKKNRLTLLYRKENAEICNSRYMKQKEHYDFVCKKIARKIESKQKIRVAFHVVVDTVFPAKFVFEKMLNDDIFDPFIIVIPDVLRGNEYICSRIEKSYQSLVDLYSKERVFRGYIADLDKYVDYSDDFDIYCFCNPYDHMTHKYYQIDYIKSKNLLNIYLEYGNLGTHKYTPKYVIKEQIMSMFWKVFTQDSISFKEYKLNQDIKGKNVIISGYYTLNEYKENINKKNIIRKRKNIIIAPHHTVGKEANNIFPLSTFIEYADFFLELPRIYPEIDFIFRPHPLLFQRLKHDDLWGKEKTEVWLHDLLENKNIVYSEGDDFIDIFINSDGIIHDCSSFLKEYLFTGYPCCYLIRTGIPLKNTFTEFGIKCLKQYYIASDENDVLKYIGDVILKGIDPLKVKRRHFFNKYLYQTYNPEEIIINEIINGIIKIKC